MELMIDKKYTFQAFEGSPINTGIFKGANKYADTNFLMIGKHPFIEPSGNDQREKGLVGFSVSPAEFIELFIVKNAD